MENASKALIIAGAILISILLISVGIIIMNAINNPVQQGASTADSLAVETFNGKFTGYMGRQKGSVIKSLWTAWNSSKAEMVANEGNGFDFANSFVVNIGQGANAINNVAGLNNNTEYTVTITDANGNNGYYDMVTVGP